MKKKKEIYCEREGHTANHSGPGREHYLWVVLHWWVLYGHSASPLCFFLYKGFVCFIWKADIWRRGDRSFICWLQWSELSGSETRSFFMVFYTDAGSQGHFLLSQSINKELDQKWYSWDTNRFHMGCCRHRISQPVEPWCRPLLSALSISSAISFVLQ